MIANLSATLHFLMAANKFLIKFHSSLRGENSKWEKKPVLVLFINTLSISHYVNQSVSHSHIYIYLCTAFEIVDEVCLRGKSIIRQSQLAKLTKYHYHQYKYY